MFASITTLPPRTKRWAEAKVLADCIDIKVRAAWIVYSCTPNCPVRYANCTYTTTNIHWPFRSIIRTSVNSVIFLGYGEPVKTLSSFGAGWRGSECDLLADFVNHLTSCRQRIMAELLEHGMRSTLTLPIHRPSLLETPITMPSQQSDALTSLGLNPAHALQHPAFYYYTSARYTEKRREMFTMALELEVNWCNRRGFPSDQVSRLVVRLPNSPLGLRMRRKSIIFLSSLR